MEKEKVVVNEFEGYTDDMPIPSASETEDYQRKWDELMSDIVEQRRKAKKEVDNPLNDHITCIRMLTDEETDFLIDRVIRLNDQTAVNRLVESNLRLVIAIASKYTRAMNLSLDDLFTYGVMGLETGIRKYDPTNAKGTKLGSYVFYWIHQAIKRHGNNYIHPIKIPAHLVYDINEVRRAVLDLSDTGVEGNATFQDIADYINQKRSEREGATAKRISAKKVEDLYPYIFSQASLDQPTGEEDGDTFLNTLNLSTESEVENLINRISQSEFFEEALSILSDKERQVIMLRYGMSDKDGPAIQPMRLGEVSAFVAISKEGVRQIENHARYKLFCFAQAKGISRDDIYIGE